MGEIKTNSQLLWQLECQKYTSQFNHTNKDSKPPSLSVEEVHCVATSIIHSNNNNNLSDTNCFHSILNRENQVNCQWKWIQMDMVVPWIFMGKNDLKLIGFYFLLLPCQCFFFEICVPFGIPKSSRIPFLLRFLSNKNWQKFTKSKQNIFKY